MAVKLVNMAIDRMTREDLNTLADELEVDRTKLYDVGCMFDPFVWWI
jgi:hypothetical protein